MRFIPQEYWTLEVELHVEGEKKPLYAKFSGEADNKIEITTQAQMDQIVEELKQLEFTVQEIRRGERTKKVPLPFTTSTLQQEAANVLNFSTQKTMRLAQQLYEGVDIKGEGTIGIITYLRTDSTRISDEANQMAQEYITSVYGGKTMWQVM